MSLLQNSLKKWLKRPLPAWLVYFLVFGLLITVIQSVYFWQMNRVRANLQHNATERATMIAKIIEENLHLSSAAHQTIDTILTAFLADNIRFIKYLETIEPLHSDELSALAKEMGLRGITILRPDGQHVSGPERWFDDSPSCTGGPEKGQLRYEESSKTAYFIQPVPDQENLSCIIVGWDARKVLDLREKTSRQALIASLSALPGINYIRLNPDRSIPGVDPAVTLLRNGDQVTAETWIATRDGVLVIGLDARRFVHRLESMRRQFIMFGTLMLSLGLLFGWILYRYQQDNLNRTKLFERELAREREDAALGRTTGTIAHEIRNPLNAINMGLQRLSLESDNLTREQEELIRAMREAVQRTANIVTELQRFARPLHPRPRKMDPAGMIKRILSLYGGDCKANGIEVTTDLQVSGGFRGDQDLLAELFDNLIKNGLEAQMEGGHLDIRLRVRDNTLQLWVTNRPCVLDADDLQRFLEPYFTTKTRGTGLGLPLCRRIAKAHGGNLEISHDKDRLLLTVLVLIPEQPGKNEKDRAS
ncbi:sensor histidine kinase [Desulfolithobacter sp.]